jgi:hypothetical protein
MKQFTLIAVLASMLWIQTATAQSTAPEQSTRLRVTGTLLPMEEQQRDDLVTATVFVQDKPWLFRVGKAEGLTSEAREQAVKDGALLEQVRFYGPDAVMRRLQKANLIGKLLVIEGQLDAKGRRFLISSVEEASGATPQSH